MKRITVSLLLTLALSSVAHASAFVGGIVDTSNATPPLTALNARVQPKPTAAISVAIPHGSNLSLTGPCRRYNASYTTILSAFSLKTTPKAQAQAKMGFPRVWCAVWAETQPGQFQTRWVSAKFVTLQ
jgi:hypothetical protein